MITYINVQYTPIYNYTYTCISQECLSIKSHTHTHTSYVIGCICTTLRLRGLWFYNHVAGIIISSMDMLASVAINSSIAWRLSVGDTLYI